MLRDSSTAPAPARPRRVLFVSSCVLGGGAGWSLYYLLKHLDRRRVEPIVVVPEPGIFEARLRALDLRVHVSPRLPHRFAQQRFAREGAVMAAASDAINVAGMGLFIAELARLIRRERVELVYANNVLVKPLGALAAQATGVPCILHVRNLHEAPARVAFQNAIARLPAVKALIANSSASAVPYARAVPDKIEVVYNGIDLAEYTAGAVAPGTWRRERGIPGDELVVGFTGNLIPRKGLDVLIRAAARVLKGRPRVRFVALGRVPVGTRRPFVPELQALARELGIDHRFELGGFVPDVRAAVADFDVLALPSRQEPFGRSVIEAMALGTPVVASRVGGIPEIIDDGHSGLLVPPGDAEALAGALARLCDDAALRRTIGEAGRRRVHQAFDVAVLTQRIEDIICDTLDESTP